MRKACLEKRDDEKREEGDRRAFINIIHAAKRTRWTLRGWAAPTRHVIDCRSLLIGWILAQTQQTLRELRFWEQTYKSSVPQIRHRFVRWNQQIRRLLPIESYTDKVWTSTFCAKRSSAKLENEARKLRTTSSIRFGGACFCAGTTYFRRRSGAWWGFLPGIVR